MRAEPRPRWTARIAGLVAVTLVLSAPLDLVGAPPASAGRNAMEKEAKALLNKARKNRNLRTIKISAKFSKVARKHSRRMARSGNLFHSDIRRTLRRCGCSYVAENVGSGRSVSQVHGAFMGSAGHRRNILRPSWRRVGIGVTTSGSRVWVTQIFIG